MPVETPVEMPAAVPMETPATMPAAIPMPAAMELAEELGKHEKKKRPKDICYRKRVPAQAPPLVSKARVATSASPARLPEDFKGIAEAVQAGEIPTRTAQLWWTQLCRTDLNQAVFHAADATMKLAGIDGFLKVDHIVDVPNAPQRVMELLHDWIIQEELDFSSYPLDLPRKGINVPRLWEEFWSYGISEADPTELVSKGILNIICRWLAPMTKSHCRPLRHASTIALMAILVVTQSSHQSFASEQKTSKIQLGQQVAGRGEQRAEALKQRVATASRFAQLINAVRTEILESVVLPRLRDPCQGIRLQILSVLASLLANDHEFIIHNKFSERFFQALVDPSAVVRRFVLMRMTDWYQGLESRPKAVTSHLVSLLPKWVTTIYGRTMDTDVRVAIAALQCLRVEVLSDHLSNKQFENVVDTVVCARHHGLREQAALFVNERVFKDPGICRDIEKKKGRPAEKEKNKGENEDGRKTHSNSQGTLDDFFETDESIYMLVHFILDWMPETIAFTTRVVEVFWPRAPVLKKFASMVTLFFYGEEDLGRDANQEKMRTILLHIIEACVKRAILDYHTAKDWASLALVNEACSEIIGQVPRCFQICRAEPEQVLVLSHITKMLIQHGTSVKHAALNDVKLHVEMLLTNFRCQQLPLTKDYCMQSLVALAQHSPIAKDSLWELAQTVNTEAVDALDLVETSVEGLFNAESKEVRKIGELDQEFQGVLADLVVLSNQVKDMTYGSVDMLQQWIDLLERRIIGFQQKALSKEADRDTLQKLDAAIQIRCSRRDPRGSNDFARLTSLYIRRAEVCMELSGAYVAAAADDCSSALELNPKAAKAARIRAQAHRRMNQWADAQADYELALGLQYDAALADEYKSFSDSIPNRVVGDKPQLWKIVGGKAVGGIWVREGAELKSKLICRKRSDTPWRLALGAQVEEIELSGGRLHYKKLSGDGPAKGWVSLKTKDGKSTLAEPIVTHAPDPPRDRAIKFLSEVAAEAVLNPQMCAVEVVDIESETSWYPSRVLTLRLIEAAMTTVHWYIKQAASISPPPESSTMVPEIIDRLREILAELVAIDWSWSVRFYAFCSYMHLDHLALGALDIWRKLPAKDAEILNWHDNKLLCPKVMDEKHMSILWTFLCSLHQRAVASLTQRAKATKALSVPYCTTRTFSMFWGQMTPPPGIIPWSSVDYWLKSKLSDSKEEDGTDENEQFELLATLAVHMVVDSKNDQVYFGCLGRHVLNFIYPRHRDSDSKGLHDIKHSLHEIAVKLFQRLREQGSTSRLCAYRYWEMQKVLIMCQAKVNVADAVALSEAFESHWDSKRGIAPASFEEDAFIEVVTDAMKICIAEKNLPVIDIFLFWVGDKKLVSPGRREELRKTIERLCKETKLEFRKTSKLRFFLDDVQKMALFGTRKRKRQNEARKKNIPTSKRLKKKTTVIDNSSDEAFQEFYDEHLHDQTSEEISDEEESVEYLDPKIPYKPKPKTSGKENVANANVANANVANGGGENQGRGRGRGRGRGTAKAKGKSGAKPRKPRDDSEESVCVPTGPARMRQDAQSDDSLSLPRLSASRPRLSASRSRYPGRQSAERVEDDSSDDSDDTPLDKTAARAAKNREASADDEARASVSAGRHKSMLGRKAPPVRWASIRSASRKKTKFRGRRVAANPPVARGKDDRQRQAHHKHVRRNRSLSSSSESVQVPTRKK